MRRLSLPTLLLHSSAVSVSADHGAHTDLGGKRTYSEEAVDEGMTRVLEIEIVEETARVTVFPCFGEFEW